MAAKWDIQDKFSDPLLRVVGQITIAAGQLEWVSKLAYKRARNVGFDKGIAEAEGLDFPGRCDETQKHFNKRINDPEVRQEMSEILARANQAWLDRHTVIHAVFARSLPDGELRRYFKRKPTKKVWPKGQYLDPSVEELRAVRNDLRKARDELHFFTKKYLLGKKP